MEIRWDFCMQRHFANKKKCVSCAALIRETFKIVKQHVFSEVHRYIKCKDG